MINDRLWMDPLSTPKCGVDSNQLEDMMFIPKDMVKRRLSALRLNEFTWQILGFDVMLDQKLQPWLLEAGNWRNPQVDPLIWAIAMLN